MDEYYRAVAERGLPFGDQDTFLNPVGVPDETIAVDVDVTDRYERKVAAISQHRSQIGELERLPRDLRPLHLAHECFVQAWPEHSDRKSTRLNSSHLVISYAVFCLKKKQAMPP